MDHAIVLARQNLEASYNRDQQELERRLRELNQLRESFERDKGIFVQNIEYRPWRDGVNRALTILETRAAVWTAVVGFVVIVVEVLLRWMHP